MKVALVGAAGHAGRDCHLKQLLGWGGGRCGGMPILFGETICRGNALPGRIIPTERFFNFVTSSIKVKWASEYARFG